MHISIFFFLLFDTIWHDHYLKCREIAARCRSLHVYCCIKHMPGKRYYADCDLCSSSPSVYPSVCLTRHKLCKFSTCVWCLLHNPLLMHETTLSALSFWISFLKFERIKRLLQSFQYTLWCTQHFHPWVVSTLQVNMSNRWKCLPLARYVTLYWGNDTKLITSVTAQAVKKLLAHSLSGINYHCSIDKGDVARAALSTCCLSLYSLKIDFFFQAI